MLPQHSNFVRVDFFYYYEKQTSYTIDDSRWCTLRQKQIKYIFVLLPHFGRRVQQIDRINIDQCPHCMHGLAFAPDKMTLKGDWSPYLEYECIVEFRRECLASDTWLLAGILVRKKVQFNERISRCVRFIAPCNSTSLLFSYIYDT